jgi:hypothetical protein
MSYEHGGLPEGKALTGNLVNARQSSRELIKPHLTVDCQ